MKILSLLAAILVSGLFSLARAAGPVAWPDHILRGANVATNLTETDVALLALDWKANSCRLLINDLVPDKPPYRPSEEQKKRAFETLDLLLKYNLYTVFSPSPSFRDNDLFFSNPEYRKAYVECWQDVARRYKDAGPIAYDLMNEPHDSLARTEWSGFARELTKAIRAIDSVHTIVVEPPEWGWADGFKFLEPTGDPNTVYSFHFYGPMDYTHQRNGGHMQATEEQWKERVYPGATMQGEVWDRARLEAEVQKAVAYGKAHGVKIWCGEFGVARWAVGAPQYMRDWIELCEASGIGWNYYAFREWSPMDMEMDPGVRGGKTARGETDFTRLFREFFSRGK